MGSDHLPKEGLSISFSYSVVERHIRRSHPGCPDFAVAYMAQEISQRKWEGVSLGRAVGITMDGILRHRMTDYDTLLLTGMDRKEARKRVQPKVQALLEVWAKPPRGGEEELGEVK